MQDYKNIVVVVKNENPDCEQIQNKLMDLLDNFSSEELLHSKISLHMPECNLMNFMSKEKEFTKNLLHHKFQVKFNHRLVKNIENEHKVILEKVDRVGNTDEFEIVYDKFYLIDTNLR